MANVSGVPVENIIKINESSRESIIMINGLSTSSIAGWVVPSVTCQTTQTFYIDLEQGDTYRDEGTLNYLCREELTTTIEIGDDGIFYVNGQCGVTQATSGYYYTGTGGRNIYRWVSGEGYTIEGVCR